MHPFQALSAYLDAAALRGGGVGVPEGQGEAQLPVASENDHGKLVAHAAALQGRVVVAHRVDILPIDGKKQVARLEAVGIGGHFIDIDTSAADAVLHSGGLVSQVNGGEASIHAAGDIALADKLFDDGLGGVYRDGEAQAFHAFLGVFRVDDADKLPLAVEQAATGVAGVDGRVGLQQGQGLIIDGDFPAQGADDAAGDGAAQLAQGVADGNRGFAHAQVLAVADTIVEAVQSGAIKKFVVMAGCDGRAKSREYYTEFAKALPKDAVILTAGCAKYKYNKLPLGDIGGIPRVLDAGQCNDSYSLAVIALKLKEIFGLDDINDLPIVYNIAWYEQKAVIVLLALLYLGVKNIHLGPTLPAFLSPNVAKVLVENFGIAGIGTVEDDLKLFFS